MEDLISPDMHVVVGVKDLISNVLIHKLTTKCFNLVINNEYVPDLANLGPEHH